MARNQDWARDVPMNANFVSTGPPPRPFLQVGPLETTFSGDVEEAREHFRTYQAIHVCDILSDSLLSMILRAVDSTCFVPGEKDTPGFREVEATPQRAGRILNLALTRSPLLRWLEATGECEPVVAIEGRVTQTINRPGDELYWHDDFSATEGRHLALVINLGARPFLGGEFALRRKNGKVLFQHKYTEVNSGMIFKVGPDLEHRVLPITAGGPRRVYAGWAFDRKTTVTGSPSV